MTTLTQNFENGTSGTTITTSNSGGGTNTAFDAVSGPPSGGTMAFSNTHADTGSLSMEIATGSTAGACLVEWQASLGTQSEIWFRVYCYLTANPSSNIGIIQVLDSSSQCAELFVLTTGALRMVNAAGGTITTTTATVPLSQWFRVEGFVVAGTSTGQTSVSLYDTAQSTTATETDTSAATQVLTASINRIYYGLVNAGLTSIGPYWLDDIGVSSIGYLGPVLLSGTGTAALALAASSAGQKNGIGSPSAILVLSASSRLVTPIYSFTATAAGGFWSAQAASGFWSAQATGG